MHKLKTVYKDWERFRLWVVTKRLPKAANNGLLLGRTFDEWVSMGNPEFLTLIMEHDKEFETTHETTDDKENQILYATINNVKSMIGYNNAVRNEISHYQTDPWGILSLPVYSNKITGYGRWWILDSLEYYAQWKELKEENKERIEKARMQFEEN